MRDNFSIVIPTYNRDKYLLRILSYFAEHNYECKIVIADSSFEEKKILNQRVVNSFSQLQIEYLSFHPDVNFYQKLADTINSVTTKYCVLCADDDFITHNSMKKCIDFLQRNPEFTAVGGYYYDFLALKRSNKKKTFYWRKYLFSSENIENYMTITTSEPKDRLSIHFKNYFPTIYYIHRTDFLQMVYKEVLQNTSDVRFGEILLDMLTIIHGKIQTLDILYGARESIVTSSTSMHSRLSHFVKNGTYDEKFQKFRECLVNHLIKKQEITVQDAEKIINDGMEAYIQNRLAVKKEETVNWFRKLARMLFIKLRYFRINVSQYRKFSFKKQIDLEKWNTSDPPKKYLDDFNDIKEIVLKML